VKRVLFLIAVLAPAAALIGVLWNDRAGGLGPKTPSVAQRVGVTPGMGASASRPTTVSMAEGSGADLFVRRDGVAVIDGETITYPRVYAFAKSWQHGEAGVILARDPVIIFNARPRNEHELARLLRITVDSGSAAAGAELLRAFGSHRGLRSAEARIHGNADLSVISRVDLLGGVEAVLVDPEVPGDAAVLVTESLTLEFTDQKLVAVRTDAHFTMTRPAAGDLEFSARGVEVLIESGVAKIFHDISVLLIPPERFGGPREPINLQTPGPVLIRLAPRPDGQSPAFSLADARIAAEGGVSFSRGDLSGSGRRATAAFDAGSQVESLELQGDAHLRTSDGEARGTRLVLRPAHPSELARLEGAPVAVTFPDGTSFIPSQWGRDVTLTTPGAIVVSPESPAGELSERTITIGPKIAVLGSLGRLDADRIVAVVGTPDADRIRHFRVTFTKVSAHDAETDLDAEGLSITRARGTQGLDDVIAFTGRYDITTRPKQRQDGAFPPLPVASPAAAKSAIPAFGGSPVRLRGDGGLVITRPFLDERPIVATATEKFRLDALEEGTAKSRGWLEARRGRLVVELVPGVKAPGAFPTRDIRSFVAEGRVRIEVAGRALASGETLTYDGGRRDVVLVGGGTEDPARIERGADPDLDWLSAGTITFQIDLLRLIATRGVAGNVALQPLPWIGLPPSRELVRTQMTAQRMVAYLDSVKFEDGEVALTEILAEIAVSITQPQAGRRLAADLVQFDQTYRSGVIRGQPVRYDIRREVDGAVLPEGLTCPMLVVDTNRLLVEGPSEATLHTKPGSPGILPNLGDAAKGSQSRPAPATAPTPVRLRCGGRTLVAEEFIRCDVNVVIEQGDPDRGGMIASGDSATLFLEKDPAQPKNDPDFGLAVIQGNARFKSVDFDASSDVMKLNRVMKLITLVNERPEKLVVMLNRSVVGSNARNGVARLDIDYSKPGKPAITAFDHDVVLEPETRSSQP
jgi:hypothetical protein